MKTRYKVLIGFVVVLIIIRLILPHVVLHIANENLARLPGYYGHIKEIQMNLYRGGFILNDFHINKIDPESKRQTLFFKANTIDLSLEWMSLFHGAIVGKLALHSPVLKFTKNKFELEDMKNDTTDFRKKLKNVMPLRVNRFEMHNAELQYVDSTSEPLVDVSIKNTHILAVNLTNVTNKNVELPSEITVQADVYEGVVNFQVKFDVLAEHPTFEFDAELDSTNLALLADFFKAYGKVDVSSGIFGLYTEMAAKDGRFIGYVKPVIKNLSVKAMQGRNTSIVHTAWAGLVGVVAEVFTNKDKNQIATKIPIEGAFTDPEPDIYYAIWNVLHNAFVQALSSSIDNEISLSSIAND